MVFRRRADAVRVPDLPGMRRMVPLLMPTRIESMVYYPQQIDVGPLLRLLAGHNQGRPDHERITFFHLVLTALARTFRLRPELNRFIAGGRTYAHREISFSFTVKRELTDAAPETQVRLVFTGRETVAQVRDRVDAELARARGQAPGVGDRLITTLSDWPRPALDLLARIVFGLDHLNVMPGFLRREIPVYASAYLVNLGSLGAEAPYHHLYQQGTASAFVAIGAIRKDAVVDDTGAIVARDRVTVVYTLDERTTEGFYAVRSAQLLQRMLEAPEQLLEPPAD